MKIAVLFDGAGLARLGLEQSGHECVGYELDPSKHYLSQFVGSGNCILQDATTVDLASFDAIWASPPCQEHSDNKLLNGNKKSEFSNRDLLKWSLDLIEKYPNKIIWIENTIPVSNRKEYARYMITHKHLMKYGNDWQWGQLYNAAQFLEEPIQQRRRMIGGSYIKPEIYREFKYSYKCVCPSISASIYNDYSTGHLNSVRRAECLYYGRCLSLREVSYHQGFEIPDTLCKSWFHNPILIGKRKFTDRQWRNNLYEALGNGVPVYMAKAFGDMYSVD